MNLPTKRELLENVSRLYDAMSSHDKGCEASGSDYRSSISGPLDGTFVIAMTTEPKKIMLMNLLFAASAVGVFDMPDKEDDTNPLNKPLSQN